MRFDILHLSRSSAGGALRFLNAPNLNVSEKEMWWCGKRGGRSFTDEEQGHFLEIWHEGNLGLFWDLSPNFFVFRRKIYIIFFFSNSDFNPRISKNVSIFFLNSIFSPQNSNFFLTISIWVKEMSQNANFLLRIPTFFSKFQFISFRIPTFSQNSEFFPQNSNFIFRIPTFSNNSDFNQNSNFLVWIPTFFSQFDFPNSNFLIISIRVKMSQNADFLLKIPIYFPQNSNFFSQFSQNSNFFPQNSNFIFRIPTFSYNFDFCQSSNFHLRTPKNVSLLVVSKKKIICGPNPLP